MDLFLNGKWQPRRPIQMIRHVLNTAGSGSRYQAILILRAVCERQVRFLVGIGDRNGYRLRMLIFEFGRLRFLLGDLEGCGSVIGVGIGGWG